VKTLPEDHPLRRLFAGLTEHSFQCSLGVADPGLIDYLSGLLSRFLHADAVYRVRDGQGNPLAEVAEMLVEARSLPDGGRTQREVYRHIGDFTLFWTGLFPEALGRQRSSWSKDSFISYTLSGKQSYLRASQYVDDACESEAPILFRLSKDFEMCAFGLNQVRKEWEQLAASVGPGPAKLIGTR